MSNETQSRDVLIGVLFLIIAIALLLWPAHGQSIQANKTTSTVVAPPAFVTVSRNGYCPTCQTFHKLYKPEELTIYRNVDTPQEERTYLVRCKQCNAAFFMEESKQ